MSKRKRTRVSSSPPSRVNNDLGTVSLSDGDTGDEGTNTDDPKDESPVQTNGADAVVRFGLDKTLKDDWSMIVALMDQHIADEGFICHLRDVPSDAIWSSTNTLSTSAKRAIVIVAFGSLSAVKLNIQRYKSSTAMVSIELLRQADKDKMQMIRVLADPHVGVADPRLLSAARTSADPKSRLLNVYDRTGPVAEVRMLGMNYLLGGDVVRLDMRCVRVPEGSGFRVDFKLKSIHLVAAIPRGVDVMR